MIPGLGNPAQMRRMMQQLGMKSEEINAKRVIIELENSRLVIEQPQVTSIEVQGQKTYTVMGKERREEGGAKEASAKEIPEDDVRLVAAQAAVSTEKAKKALEECDGDLAEAIKLLKK
ncbi:MAG: nascent polypeptide-associated complex protein [Candidatus Diapherotrites archaeon]|nr:nascent polypeptide-associated complex protein [Candidatus Diapherotrites archaeon]